METIRNKNSVAKMIDSNTCHIQYLASSNSTIDDFIEGNKCFKAFSRKKSLKKLIELTQFASLNLDPFEYDKHNTIAPKAEAIVVNTLAQRLLFTFYLKIRKHLHPAKLFKTKEEALIWLEKYH